MATDGVFDNLYDEDLENCVRPNMKDKDFSNMQAASTCISDLSSKLGRSNNYLSPFALHAKEHKVNYPNQGKLDDITVISAQIHTKGRGDFEKQSISTNGNAQSTFDMGKQDL